MAHNRRKNFGKSLCLLLMLLLDTVISDDFTTSCPRPCECKWQSGNKAADCSNGSLSSVPKNLSNEIQNLDLSGNPLFEIVQGAFHSVGLSNVKKLNLRECQLITIHKDGFSNLAIMIELDLSRNNLKTLYPDTFRETEKLRWVYINNNQIEKLEEGLFRNLAFLQKVEISNNKLFRLGVKTFMNLPVLQILKLDGNNLTHMKLDTISSLSKLSGLDLHNNPWRCDCNLQPFRDWVIKYNLYTPPTACAEPPQVYKKLWNEIESTDFACKPNIVLPHPGTKIRATEENVTMTCKVIGNPLPEVNWVLNSRIIDNESRKHGDHRYVIQQNIFDLTRWVNLTIVQVRYTDRGDFTCVAKNPGGVEERNISLDVAKSSGAAGAGNIDNESLPLLIGLSVGAIILLIVIAILIYCFCRKRDTKRHVKSDMHSPNGDALIEGSVIPEMEKSLITVVNPVTKPPRRYDAPPSVTSGATEMSELNRTLLDSDSVFAPNEDESRSADFIDQTLPKRSQDTLSVDYQRHDNRTYPPDLLSFPPRGTQVSPAASSASTAPDNSRLPLQHSLQSPIHSPIYGTNPNIFRTLPYSRSQSPFTAPISPPVVTPRQGYVTIPRRPRVPSWSSTASNVTTTVLPNGDIIEPVYDNLGLRTTADGSSVLSLNKAGLEQPFSPMRGRPLPATPTSYQQPSSVLYAPIEELEPAPSPAPRTPYNNQQTSISSPNIHHQLSSPISEPQHPGSRLSYARNLPETPRSNTPSMKYTPVRENAKSPAPSMTGNGTLGRSGKIPPRPPPKPKKKTSTGSNGPLFEDECEDGTEV